MFRLVLGVGTYSYALSDTLQDSLHTLVLHHQGSNRKVPVCILSASTCMVISVLGRKSQYALSLVSHHEGSSRKTRGRCLRILF